MTPDTADPQILTQAKYVAATDRNRAREWRCLQVVTLGEIILFCFLGWAVMFPHDLYLVLKPIFPDAGTFWKIYRSTAIFACIVLLLGLLLPVLTSINISRCFPLHCPHCRKNLFHRPQNGSNIANLCPRCGAMLFADDPLFAANHCYNSSVVISLTLYVLWIVNLFIFAMCFAKSKDITTDIASYLWVLAALLLFLLPVLYYLPQNKFFLRRAANRKPPELHLDQTVILQSTRAKIKKLLSLTAAVVFIVLLLWLLGFVGIFAVTRPGSDLALTAAMIWLLGFLGMIVWFFIRCAKKIPDELSGNCPVCKRGGSYSFIRRGRQRFDGFDNIFWQQVLKTGRCRHCGCRIVFADDAQNGKNIN